MDFGLIDVLKQKKHETLPGKPAQFQMAHNVRQIPEIDSAPAHAKKAAVLILLYPKGSDWHFVLMERTSRFGNDKHKGQISLPGGAYETTDADLSETALRETEEEMGVPISDMNLVAPLTDLYIPVSNFHVFPFYGFCESEPTFYPDRKEVAEILEIPLAHIQHPDNSRLTNIKISKNILLKEVPYYDFQGKIIWGATAMILSEFLTLLK